MQTRKNIATNFLLLTLAAGAQCIYAQSMGTGTIKGIVTDPSGAAVHNAAVTAIDQSRHIPRTVRTDASGGYVFSNMQIGGYQISVESTGFKKLVQESVRLDTDSITTVDVVLQLGATQESVTVTAAPPQLQTENGEIGNLITGAQVSELSLNGRNFSQFVTLSPGVASSQTGRRMGVGQEGNPLMSVQRKLRQQHQVSPTTACWPWIPAATAV